jgi:hypothetical protein
MSVLKFSGFLHPSPKGKFLAAPAIQTTFFVDISCNWFHCRLNRLRPNQKVSDPLILRYLQSRRTLQKNGAPTWQHEYQAPNIFLYSRMTLNLNQVINILPRYISVFHPSAYKLSVYLVMPWESVNRILNYPTTPPDNQLDFLITYFFKFKNQTQQVV